MKTTRFYILLSLLLMAGVAMQAQELNEIVWSPDSWVYSMMFDDAHTDHPKIVCASTVSFLRNSTLHLQVPRGGYAKDFVPVDLACNFMLDSTTAMELDCEEWAAHTGGTVHLISAKAFEDNPADESSTTVARLNATSLPPDCRLVVSSGNVYLKCPRRKGFRVVIR